MNCNECGTPMTQIDPREIADPQPSRYVPRWRCDERECPRQGEVVEDDGAGEQTHCRQCGNPLTEKDVQQGAVFCDPCWHVRADYHYLEDYDEFEEEDEIYICEFCGGEYSHDGGWSTCGCSERWGTAESEGETP